MINDKNGGVLLTPSKESGKQPVCTADGAIDGEFGSGDLKLDMIIGYARKIIQPAVRNAHVKSVGRLQLKM